jgi:hypothetical protein
MSITPPEETDGDGEDAETKNVRAQRQRVLDRRTALTNRISEQTRYIAFGALAFVYGVYVSESPIPVALVAHHSSMLRSAAAFAAIALVLDYLQYVAFYEVASQAKKNKAGGYRYDERSGAYAWGQALFWGKQIAVLLAIILIVVVVGSIPGSRASPPHPPPPADSGPTVNQQLESLRNEVGALNRRVEALENRGQPAARTPPRRCNPASETWNSDGSFRRSCRE